MIFAKMVKNLTGRGIVVEFVKEHLVFTGDDSPMSQLLLSMLGAVSEFERAMIRERQREGIIIAKRNGIYKGRKPSLSTEQVASLREKEAGGMSIASIGREFGVSRQTIYTYLSKAA